MENKLISMTDFVLEQKKLICEDYKTITEVFFYRKVDYANCLKQPLTLGMFVPCDENGNVLEAGGRCQRNCSCGEEGVQDCRELRWEKFEKAKEKVLFKGFYLEQGEETDYLTTYLLHEEINEPIAFKKEWVDNWDFQIDMEDLAKYGAIELTDSALKQIGLKTK